MPPTDSTWNPIPDLGTAPAPNVSMVDPGTNMTVTADPSGAMPVYQPPADTSTIPQQEQPDYTNPGVEMPHEAWWKRALSHTASAMAGNETWTVTKTPDGQVSVTQHPSTEKEKWGRIAATMLGGLAEGLPRSFGPAGPANAAAAGIKTGLQAPQQWKNEADAQATQEQKRMEANANNAILQQRQYISMLTSHQLETQIAEGDAAMLSEYENALTGSPGAKDYGMVTGFDDLKRLKENDPDFWKSHADFSLKTMPVRGKNGRPELHAVATDPGWDARRIGEGQFKFRLDYDAKTDTTTLIKDPLDPGSTTNGKLALANSGVLTQWMESRNKKKLADAAETKATQDRIPKSASEALAQAALTTDPSEKQRLNEVAVKMQKAEEDLRRAGRSQTNINTGVTAPGAMTADLIKPGGAFGPGTVNGTDAQKLASGDWTEDRIPKRMAKGAPTPQEFVAAAEAWSQNLYGLGYSPTEIGQEKKFFEDMKSQGVLDGIDKMIGVKGEPGYLDTVLSLSQQAGIKDTAAPINRVKQHIKSVMGDAAANKFATALGEVQRNLPQLIGNPILGGADSDLKLKMAIDMFAKNPTLAGLQGQAEVLRSMMSGSRDSYTRENRFFQRRYGLQGPYAKQFTATHTQPNTSAGSQGGQSNVPPGKVPAYVGGQLVGYADDNKGTNYHAF